MDECHNMLRGDHCKILSFTKREGNGVAHSLASLTFFVYWVEEIPSQIESLI